MTGTNRIVHKRMMTIVLTGILLMAGVLLTACSAAPGIDTGEEEEQTSLELLEEGSYQAAAESFAAEIEAGDDTEGNYRYLGIAYMGAGDYESAAAAFETALEKAGIVPSDMEYDINYYLGSCYYKLGRYEDALEVYDAIVALRPSEADAWQLRGTVRLKLGDEEGMLSDYVQALDLEPDNYDRLISIYEIMEENGYADEGLGLLEDALSQSSGDMSNYDLGRISYYAGDYETARTALEQLANSTDADVVLMLGKTYEALGDYNYATNVYKTYLSSDAANALVYNQLGLCCLKMEDYESALEAFQNGIATGDGAAMQSLKFNEIIAYEYLGDFETAASRMEEYIAAYPGDAAARREYVFLSTR